MLQVIQSLKDGTTDVVEVPSPEVRPGCLLIRSHTSVISPGTEKMLLEFGKANLLNKARLQPDKLKQALDKIRTDGLMATVTALHSKLLQPIPLGYCNSGSVIAVGTGVNGFAVGDRVISNGPHAQIVCVPKHLCAKIPKTIPPISDEEAAFTVLGAIALQGIRLLNPTLGETVAVQGLGIIGLISVQLLRANGCHVLAMDFDESKLKLASEFGAKVFNLSNENNCISFAELHTAGRGIDGALVTASTGSSSPIKQAANMCRKRGRIILVGVTGLHLDRSDFYEKEISFQVSCSYGPGRYDPVYEQRGADYPYGLVRWTEQRNFEAILNQLRDGQISFSSLISKRMPIADANLAYRDLHKDPSLLGILLKFPIPEDALNDISQGRTIHYSLGKKTPAIPAVGLIGTGKYSQSVLLPHLNSMGANVQILCSQGGLSAALGAKRYKIPVATTDAKQVISNKEINCVVIATPHDSHASYALEALREGKNVYIEKPLAIKLSELQQIESLFKELSEKGQSPILSVGFNRRFAPLSVALKQLTNQILQPKSAIITVNAGKLPNDDWQLDAQKGGGRLVGEACHFIDLLRFLIGHPIIELSVCSTNQPNEDISLQLRFADGSTGTIHYFSSGHRAFPKERIEVFGGGKVAVIHNFRILKSYGFSGFRTQRHFIQNKGHRESLQAFFQAVKLGMQPPVPIAELLEVSRYAIKAQSATAAPIPISEHRLAG